MSGNYGNHGRYQLPVYYGPNGGYYPTPPKRSPIALIAVIVLLVLVIAAVLIFVLTRSDGDIAEAADTAEPTETTQTTEAVEATEAVETTEAPGLAVDDAEQAVEEFFAAISRGDAEAASALLDTTLDTTLVNNDIYSDVTNVPVLEYLTVVDASESQVVLSAKLTEAEGPTEVEFIVELIDDSIKISSGPYFKFSLLSSEDFVINGHRARLPGGSDYLLLPGDWDFEYVSFAWQLRVTADGRGIELPDDTPEPAESRVDEPLTEEEMDEVAAQFDTWIESCLDDPHFAPEGCENTLFMEDPGIAVTGISRTIEERPMITYWRDGDEHWVELFGGTMRIEYQLRESEADEWEAAEPVYRYDIYDGILLPIEGRGDDIRVDFSAL